ncbi:hypothetical protein ASG01_09870 [Chryseobacterium sp. Leaf180]|uniref:DUF4269 domain-containing protein n=1 Tax=Chryseobacterium sp. Leaf180 TaxID=1736289 RepID=UPI0006FBE1B0|nr:DUF4269 domain-containing protein [Chryseobacterium sp. Leaf180]KQR93479.1 hypothetical protein ASG01_09870 [Chryseobacterium sp. Leaf180]
MNGFLDLSYLKTGNARQKKAFVVLKQSQLFDHLKEFTPVLAGTIPIEVDTEESDLDVICEVKNFEKFRLQLLKLFPHNEIEEVMVNGERTIILNTVLADFKVEIFGQNIPVIQQNAYRHLLAEATVLKEKGDDFRNKVIELKKQGIKTETAFGILLNLKNPYQELLNYTKND